MYLAAIYRRRVKLKGGRKRRVQLLYVSVYAGSGRGEKKGEVGWVDLEDGEGEGREGGTTILVAMATIFTLTRSQLDFRSVTAVNFFFKVTHTRTENRQLSPETRFRNAVCNSQVKVICSKL